MVYSVHKLDHWAIKSVDYSSIADGMQKVATTNNPCHLVERWSKISPAKFKLWKPVRGGELECEIRTYLKSCQEIEQEEIGDTILHTFHNHGWPICETRWFYFKGRIKGKLRPGASPIFKYHRSEIPYPGFDLILLEKWTWGIPEPELELILEELWTATSEQTFEQYTSGPYGAVAIYGNNWSFQSFTKHQNQTINDVQIYACKSHASWIIPTLIVGIRNTDGTGRPTGGDLVTGYINPTQFVATPGGAWYKITFDVPYPLENAKKYAMVLRCPAGDGTHYVVWYYGTASPGYPDGQYGYSINGGSTWTLTNRDMMFKEQGTPA